MIWYVAALFVFLTMGMDFLAAPVESVAAQEHDFAREREAMVRYQLVSRGIHDQRVLEVMRTVQRHLFVPRGGRYAAYEDHPLPIGYQQTISQPYIVAYMTEAARLQKDDRVLEIGTGSGYQAAILAELAAEVYTIEIVKPLADEASQRLADLGYTNITVKHGDGYLGWPEYAPFDAIIVTAAPDEIPGKLIEQLRKGGRMVVPVGSFFQQLMLVTKTEAGEVKKESLLPVRFVPMVKGDGLEE